MSSSLNQCHNFNNKKYIFTFFNHFQSMPQFSAPDALDADADGDADDADDADADADDADADNANADDANAAGAGADGC